MDNIWDTLVQQTKLKSKEIICIVTNKEHIGLMYLDKLVMEKDQLV